MKKLFMAVLLGLFLSTSVNAEEDIIHRGPSLEQILAGQVRYGLRLDETPALIDCFKLELGKYFKVEYPHQLFLGIVAMDDFKGILAVWLDVNKAQTFIELKGAEFLDKMTPFPTQPCYLAFRYYNAEERTIISND